MGSAAVTTRLADTRSITRLFLCCWLRSRRHSRSAHREPRSMSADTCHLLRRRPARSRQRDGQRRREPISEQQPSVLRTDQQGPHQCTSRCPRHPARRAHVCAAFNGAFKHRRLQTVVHVTGPAKPGPQIRSAARRQDRRQQPPDDSVPTRRRCVDQRRPRCVDQRGRCATVNGSAVSGQPGDGLTMAVGS